MRAATKKKKRKYRVRKIAKKALSPRLKALISEKGQFARNPAFPDNIRIANISLIESDIRGL